MWLVFFFFQAEDGIRDAQESRGLGDVYKRQVGVALPVGCRCGSGSDGCLHPLLDEAVGDEGLDLSLIHI